MENKHRAPRFFAETREHWPLMSVYELNRSVRHTKRSQ
jgi:hypothetical protein